MLNTPRSTRGMVTGPHHLASQAGLRVLMEGGNAIEAMIAAAATIAVAYPHMNGLGGDNFWLVHDGCDEPQGIDACGAAAQAATLARYRDLGHETIPGRGPHAAVTVAGTVSGWQAALELSASWGGRLPLGRLLEDAVHYARSGIPVTASQRANTQSKLAELDGVPGFAASFLVDGGVPPEGALLRQPALAATLQALAERGLDDFYRGSLARTLAAGLEAAGSPIRAGDLAAHRARRVSPLDLRLDDVRLFNMPPPTQGLASLLVLGIYHRVRVSASEGFEYVHRMVEATKCAFVVRDREVTDPDFMDSDPRAWLEDRAMDTLASEIDPARARPWPPAAPASGDTVWLAAMDAQGRAVSMIQSLYWEFGSGLVIEDAGVVWQNRGVSFALDPQARNPLTPGRRPFHTIQPALALFDDGRVMAYGCMGGEGQPQSQAAVFSRYAWHGHTLQQAVTAPRWLLGRTWGEDSTGLKLESRFAAETAAKLAEAGHHVQVLGPFEELMGHAGAIVRHRNGVVEGAADPRGDGLVAAW